MSLPPNTKLSGLGRTWQALGDMHVPVQFMRRSKPPFFMLCFVCNCLNVVVAIAIGLHRLMTIPTTMLPLLSLLRRTWMRKIFIQFAIVLPASLLQCCAVCCFCFVIGSLAFSQETKRTRTRSQKKSSPEKLHLLLLLHPPLRHLMPLLHLHHEHGTRNVQILRNHNKHCQSSYRQQGDPKPTTKSKWLM